MATGEITFGHNRCQEVSASLVASRQHTSKGNIGVRRSDFTLRGYAADSESIDLAQLGIMKEMHMHAMYALVRPGGNALPRAAC